MRSVISFALALVVAAGTSAAWGQYSAVTTPFHTLNDNFFENINVGFNFQIHTPPGSGVVGLNPDGSINPGGPLFSQGPVNATAPTIGGYDPNGNAHLGFALSGSGYTAGFNFNASQGDNRVSVMQAPTVVIPNGGTGTFIDSTQIPFVTGLIPVVGDGAPAWATPRGRSVLYERLNRLQTERAVLGQDRENFERAASGNPVAGGGSSSRGTTSTANRGDLSVADIKRQQAEAANDGDRELEEIIARAEGAEAVGKRTVAKIFYRQALQRATGEKQKELQAKLQSLEQP